MNETESDYIIEGTELVKRFKDMRAVDGISLKVCRGEIYGFLGPNGAGKTTTVRMLTTMDPPTSGTILIDGRDARTEYLVTRRQIGVIQQQNSLEKDISVRENIMHHALMQGLSVAESKKRMMELCEVMELTDRLDMLVEKLSGGWKRRVSIVCSMIHKPAILFLDEPTTGLDTQSRNLLWKMIRELNREGTTIFLTTHYIFEAESLCNRVGIINKGRMVAEGTPWELKMRLGPIKLEVERGDGEHDVMYYPDRASAKKAAESVPPESNYSIRATNLEDVFLELTGRSI